MRIVILSLMFTIAGVLFIRESTANSYMDGKGLRTASAASEDLDNYYSLPY